MVFSRRSRARSRALPWPTIWSTSSTCPCPTERQIAAVHEVLVEIGAGSVSELLVFNKADLGPAMADKLVVAHPGSVAVSAITGEGIDRLAHRARRPRAPYPSVVALLVPYDRGDVLASDPSGGRGGVDDRRGGSDAHHGSSLRGIGGPARRVRRHVRGRHSVVVAAKLHRDASRARRLRLGFGISPCSGGRW